MEVAQQHRAFSNEGQLTARRDVLKTALGRWRLPKEIEPDHRFETRYRNHRRHRQRGETFKYGRLFNLAGGSKLIVAGFAFIPTPDLGYIIVIDMWTLASEFRPLARFFDRPKVRLRKLGQWIVVSCRDARAKSGA